MTAISWKTGTSGLWSNAADWSTGTVPGASDNVTISAAPSVSGQSYAVTLASSASVNAITLDQANATLYAENGTLTVGTSFGLEAGTLLLNGETLQGGTYTSTGGTVICQGFDTFSGVTLDGTLNLAASVSNAETIFMDGVTFQGSNGSGIGSLSLSAYSIELDQTALNNVAITLAGSGIDGNEEGSASLTVLSLGTGAQISTIGTSISYLDSGSLTNSGQLTDSSGANLIIYAEAFDNAGTMTASAGGTITVRDQQYYQSTSITNTGLISVGAGGLVTLTTSDQGVFTSTFYNSGSITVAAGGILALGTAQTTTQLESDLSCAGTLEILGSVTNTGATLSTSSALANIVLDGSIITGGTIVNTGNLSTEDGTLSGVTFDGAVNMSAPSGNSDTTLVITGGTVLAGATGSGGATISIASGTLQFLQNQNLSSGTITLGAAGSSTHATIAVGNYGEASATTLTLGSGLDLTQGAGSASIYAETASDGIVNDGTISVSGTSTYLTVSTLSNGGSISISSGADIGYTTLVNSGVISIAGTNSQLLTTVSGTNGSLQNSGTVSLSSGAALQLGYNKQAWSNTGTILVSASTLLVAGSFTAAALGNVQITNGGTLGLAGTLTNTGTLSTGSGTIALLSGGDIVGGTVTNTTGGFAVSAGTLSGVTFDGNLNLSANNADLTIAGGLAMSGASGSGPGTISATGTNTTLALLGSQTLSNIDNLGGSIALVDQQSEATTVTLSTTSTLIANSYTYISGSINGNDVLTGDTLINDGFITETVVHGTLDFYDADAENAGQIIVANGAQIEMSGGTFTNTGTISLSGTGTTIDFSYNQQYGILDRFSNNGLMQIGAGSSVNLGTNTLAGWSNTGTIQVAGGDLILGGTVTSKQLGTIQNSSGGTVAIQGTLANTGTLSLGSGTALSSLTLLSTGDISGGKIIDAGGGLLISGGTLSGVTYDGTLSLAASNATLTLAKGLAMAGKAGTASGTLLLTGSNSALHVSGSQNLAGTVLDIGAGTANGNGNSNRIYLNDPTSAATTLTIAGNSTISQLATYAEIYGTTTYNGSTDVPTGDTIQNTGSIATTLAGNSLYIGQANLKNTGKITIQNGATIDLDQGSLTNSGTILISGSGTPAGYSYAQAAQLAFGQQNDDGDYTENFTNSGLVTIGTGGVLDLDNPSYQGTSSLSWTNSAGRIAVAGGTLQLGGNFTTAALGSITVSSGGSVVIANDAIMNNVGATLTIGGASALSSLFLQGTIQGGTILDEGSGINFQHGNSALTYQPFDGVLNDVAYQGVLSIATASETAEITGGISLTGTSGSGTGSIALTGAGATLDFASTESLANVLVSIGNNANSSTLTGSGLTLASSATIQQIGAAAAIGSSGQTLSTITNAGLISAAQYGGTLTLAGNLANTGTIAVSNGETLVLNTTTLTNTGTISVTNGLLDVGNVTSAQLTEIQLANSPLAVTGTLTATGSTLTVGAGTALPAIELHGTILGGTINDTGNGIGFYGNAVLNGVTYKGALTVNRPLTSLTIVNGLTAESATGALPGSITLTGAGSQIIWDSAQALNNATISIGNPGNSYEGNAVSAPSIVASSGSSSASPTPVTLGNALTINQTGAYADIGGAGGPGYAATGNGTVASAAKINATFAGGNLSLEGNGFTNTGAIAISNTDTVTVGAATFINAGTMSVGAGSALDLNLYNYFYDTSLAAQSFANTGSITLAGGTIAELTDGGIFPIVPLLNSAGATISGFGTIASAIDNAGTITASTGTLTLGQPVTGSGALVVNAGATLVLSSVSIGETASFGGAGGILGLSPASFLGEIGGFASGDTIDLAGTTATAASFSASSIVVTLSTGSMLHLATTSALTGTLTATAGQHGDTLIKFAATQNHSPLEPPIVQVEQTSPLESAGMLATHTPADGWLTLHMT